LFNILYSTRSGMGLKESEYHYSLENMIQLLQITLAIELIYYVSVACIKISILLFYIRLAGVDKRFRQLCWATIILLATFLGVCLIVTLAQCVPMKKIWDITGTVHGTCIDTTIFFYTTSAFNILTDIWILVLPIKTLRAIQRRRREKIVL